MISRIEILAIQAYRKVSYPIYANLAKNNCNLFECRFTPSCSHYVEEAIYKYGAIEGTLKGIERILRCKPGYGKIEDPLR